MFCPVIIRCKEQHMEPVLFYGVPKGCSFGSIVALEWLGQPYRLCRIDMLRDMQGDLYARFNRMRKTPVLLLENGKVLGEPTPATPQNTLRLKARPPVKPARRISQPPIPGYCST